jgi:hypothetical protein
VPVADLRRRNERVRDLMACPVVVDLRNITSNVSSSSPFNIDVN